MSRVQVQVEVLKDFYLDVESNFKLVQIDESKFKSKWSEDEKGHWAIEQIETVASTLFVTRFIIKGGDAIPILEDLSVYEERAMKSKAGKLAQLESTLPMKKARYDLLSRKLEEFTREKIAREQELEALDNGVPSTPQSAQSSTSKLKKEIKIKDQDRESIQEADKEARRRTLISNLMEINRIMQLDMAEWESAQVSLISTQEKIEDIETEVAEKANSAREREILLRSKDYIDL